MAMADGLRADCAALWAEVIRAYPFPTSNLEMGGLTVDELTALKAFLLKLRSLLLLWVDVLDEPLSAPDYSALRTAIAESQQVARSKAMKLKGANVVPQCNTFLTTASKASEHAVAMAGVSATPDLIAIVGGESVTDAPLTLRALTRAVSEAPDALADAVKGAQEEQLLADVDTAVEALLEMQVTVRIVATAKASEECLRSARVAAEAASVQAESVPPSLDPQRRAASTVIIASVLDAIADIDSLGPLLARAVSVLSDRHRCTAVPTLESAAQNLLDTVSTLEAMPRSIRILCDTDAARVKAAIAALNHSSMQCGSLLEGERARFPPFALLSDDDLLALLATPSLLEVDPTLYMDRVLCGCAELLVDQGRVTAVAAASGETLTLQTPVDTTSARNAANALCQVCQAIEAAIEEEQRRAVVTVPRAVATGSAIGYEYFDRNSAQIGVLSLLLQWTLLAEGTMHTTTARCQASQSGHDDDGCLEKPLEHLGSPGASPSRMRPRTAAAARPESAAARFAKVATPLFPTAPGDQRPGSASAGVARGGKGAVAGAKSGRPHSAEHRGIVGAAAVLRKRSTFDIANAPLDVPNIAAAVPEQTAADVHVQEATNIMGQRGRPHSARHRHMSSIGRARARALLEQTMGTLSQLCALARSPAEMSKAESLVAVQHFLEQVWDRELMCVASVADARWQRQLRVYVRNGKMTVEFGAHVLRTQCGAWFVPTPTSTFIPTTGHIAFLLRALRASVLNRGVLGLAPRRSGIRMALWFLGQVLGRRVLDCSATLPATLSDFVECSVRANALLRVNDATILSPGAQSALVQATLMSMHAASNPAGLTKSDNSAAVRTSINTPLVVALAASPAGLVAPLLDNFSTCNLGAVDIVATFAGGLRRSGFDGASSLSFALKLGSVCAAVTAFGEEANVRLILRAIHNAGDALRRSRGSQSRDHALCNALLQLLPTRSRESAAVSAVINQHFGAMTTTVAFPQLRVALQAAAKQCGIELSASIMRCAMQLFEWTVGESPGANGVRTVAVIAGAASSGKSTLIDLLAATRGLSSVAVVRSRMSDPLDHVMAAVRAARVARLNAKCVCVALTGTFDASLVAALESVEDLRLIIESRDLSQLPHTVAEMAQVVRCVDQPVESDVWLPHLRTFELASASPTDVLAHLADLTEEHLLDALLFSRHNSASVGEAADLGEFSTPIRIRAFFAILKAVAETTAGGVLETAAAAECAFWVAATWAFCTRPGDKQWAAFVAQRATAGLLPVKESVFDVIFAGTSSPSWTPWLAVVRPESIEAVGLVPTAAIARALFLSRALLTAGLPVCLRGPPGSGRSGVAKAAFSMLSAHPPAIISDDLASLREVRGHGGVIVDPSVRMPADTATFARQLEWSVASCDDAHPALVIADETAPSLCDGWAATVTVHAMASESTVEEVFGAANAATPGIIELVRGMHESPLSRWCTSLLLVELHRGAKRLRLASARARALLVRTLLHSLCHMSHSARQSIDALVRAVDASLTPECEDILIGDGDRIDLMKLSEAREKVVAAATAAESTIPPAVAASPSCTSTIAGLSVVLTLRRGGNVALIASVGGGFPAELVRIAARLCGARDAGRVVELRSLVVAPSSPAAGTVVCNAIGIPHGADDRSWMRLLADADSSVPGLRAPMVCIGDASAVPLRYRETIATRFMSVLQAPSTVEELSETAIAEVGLSETHAAALAAAFASGPWQGDAERFLATARGAQHNVTRQANALTDRVARAKKTLRFATALLREIQRKPVISPSELEFEPSPEQPLRAFEGTIAFTDYPPSALRLILRVNMNESTVVDVPVAAVCASMPAEDAVSVPTSCGGLCKARVEGAGLIVVQTGSLDLRLHVAVSEGEMTLVGTAADPSAPSTAIATVTAREVIDLGALSRAWLRYGGEARGISEEQLSATPSLPSAEDLGVAPDEMEKHFIGITQLLRQTVEVADADLREAFAASVHVTGVSFATALLPLLATISFDARSAVAAAAAEALAAHGEVLLPHGVCDMKTFAAALGESVESLLEWIDVQRRDAGLPFGAMAEQCALLLRLLLRSVEGLRTVVLLCDRDDPVATWVRHFTSAAGGADGPVLQVSDADEAPPPRVGTVVLDARRTSAAVSSAIVCSAAALEAGSPQDQQLRSGLAVAASARRTLTEALQELHELVHEHADKAAELGTRALAIAALGEKRISELVASLTGARQALSDTAQYLAPNAKQVKEMEAVQSTADRLAFLLATAERTLGLMHPMYQVPPCMRDSLIQGALSVSVKASQQLADVATREFLTRLLPMVLEQDRLALAASLAVAFVDQKKPGSADALRALLQNLRRADVAAQLQFEATQHSEAQVARQAWLDQRAQEKVSSKRTAAAGAVERKKEKEEREKRFLPVEVKPDYHFLQHQQWVNVLAVAAAVPVLRTLPAAFHEQEGSGVSSAVRAPSREARWSEWLKNPGGALPGLEKDTSIGPLERLTVVHALRPDRTIAALQQLVCEVFGADLNEALSAPDHAGLLLATASAHARRPVLLLRESNDDAAVIAEVVASALSAAVRPVDAKKVTAKENLPPPTTQLTLLHGSQPINDILAGITEAFSTGDWVLVDGAELLDSDGVAALISAAASAPEEYKSIISFGVALSGDAHPPIVKLDLPRLAAESSAGLRAVMLRHYRRAVPPALLDSMPSLHWSRLVFIASFISAALEVRSTRFKGYGLVHHRPTRRTDGGLRAALAAIAAAARRADGASSQLPWDELRAAVADTLGATLEDPCDRDLTAAYVDLLVHPDVVDSSNASLGPAVPLPGDKSNESHLRALNAIPPQESPEAIGMHINFLKRAQEDLGAAVMMRVSTLTGPPKCRLAGAAVAQQRAKELQQALPHWVTADVAMLHAEARDSAISQFLFFEVRWWARFLGSVHCVLNRIAGDDPALWKDDVKTMDVADALARHMTPLAWQRATVRLESLTAWAFAMQRRHNQLVLWAHQGRPNTIDLPSLHSPLGLLRAFHLDACSQRQLAPEEFEPILELDADRPPPAYPASTALPPNGLALVGLQIEGAEVDDDGVVREASDSISAWWQAGVFPAPVVRLRLRPQRGDPCASVATASADKRNERGSATWAPLTRPNMLFTASRPSSATSVAHGKRDDSVVFRPGSQPVRAKPRESGPRVNVVEEQRLVAVPLFHGAFRSGDAIAAHVELRTTQDKNHWKLRSVALTERPALEQQV